MVDRDQVLNLLVEGLGWMVNLEIGGGYGVNMRRILVNAMKELITDPKWKLDNGAFRNGFYTEIEKKIVQGFLGTDLRATPHIDSKIKTWKKHYNLLSDMLRTSGIGWDDERKMVQIDSENVWTDYLLCFAEQSFFW